MIKNLDVGCGRKKIIGTIGVDFIRDEAVDIQWDLNNYPWPFKNNEIDKIYFNHSISHLDNILNVITECHRILKKGGVIEIVAPHYSSDNNFTDPTIKFSLGYRSMNYFIDDIYWHYKYINENKLFNLISREISFRQAKATFRNKVAFSPYKFIGIEFLANKFPRIYEKFFAFIIPATEIHFIISKK